MRVKGGLRWQQKDIADYPNVSRQRVSGLFIKGRLPTPAGEDQQGRYWRSSEVQAWAREWVREKPWRQLR